MSFDKDRNSDSEISSDIEEKLKSIEEIDEALSQFLHFTTNEENQKIIDSLITFNSKLESNKDLSQKIESVEKAKNIKKENEINLATKKKSFEDKCERSNELRAEIVNIFSFLDDQEQTLYV